MDLVHFEKVLLSNSGQRGDFDIRQDRPRFWLPPVGCVDMTGDRAVSRQVRWRVSWSYPEGLVGFWRLGQDLWESRAQGF